MSKCRFLAVVAGICLLSTPSSARIMKINDYLSGMNVMGFYTGDGNKNPTLPMESCASIGGTTTKPAGTTCSTKEINGKTCYYNCTCSSAYQYTSSNCAKPKQLSGSRCGGKYTACICPASYQYDSSNCAAPKTLSGEQCDSKYTKCECPSSYKYDSSNCDSIKLSGEQCGSKYTKCECPSAYQYTCDGLNPVGDACDGKYMECSGGSSNPEPEPSGPCNDYSKMTGPMFDGEGNTAAILAAYGESAKGSAPAAYMAAHYFPELVKSDDANFGEGKWWLPSLGEAMQIYGVDWSEISGNESEIAQKASAIATKTPGIEDVDFSTFSGNERIRAKWEPIAMASLKFWTSSELNAEKAYAAYTVYGGNANIHIFSKDNQWLVVPVTKVTLQEGQVASIGSFVDIKGNVSEQSAKAVGMIYWISPQNPLIVRIIALEPVDDGTNHSKTEFPDQTPANVAAIADDPWTCSGLSLDEGGCKVDWKNFSGSFFDGQANTQKIVATLGDRAIAAKATTQFYHPRVDKNDANFGQGKWYLPSIGEALQMQVCDWQLIVKDGKLDKFGSSIAAGDVGLPLEFREYCGPEHYKEEFNLIMDRMYEINDLYMTESPRDIIDPIWTSNELDAKSAWLRADIDDLWYDKKVYSNGLLVRPVAKVSGEFNGAQIGDLVDEEGNVNNDEPDRAVGIIFWVAPDGMSVRILSPMVLGFTDYVFDPESPFYGKSDDGFEGAYTVPWATDPGDVSSLTNNPFICVANNNGCGEEYMYNEYNCVYPKTLAGDVCGGNYNKCSCPSNYNQYCDPYPGEGDSCDGYYTSCGTCGSQYVYNRSNCQSPKVLGGDKCGDSYTTCTCPSSYNQTCTPYAGVGSACNGKYQSCSTECESGYIYNNSNCPSPRVPGGATCNGKYNQCVAPGCVGLYDGEAYTQAAISQIGNKALAAYAANQYYAPGVNANDSHFGQGKWYIPSIGEAMEICGINYNGITQLRWSNSGSTVSNYPGLGDAMSALAGIGIADNDLNSGYFWTSSEATATVVYNLRYSEGYRENYGGKGRKYKVRPITKLNNVLSGTVAVGEIVYSDLSHGPVSAYDGSKTAVGVVAWVSSSNDTVIVMALKNLQFTDASSVGNFNPASPYSGNVNSVQWSTSDNTSTNITGIPDITEVSNKSSCGMTASCPTSYVTCEAPYEGVGEACDGKYASCSSPYVEVGTYNAKRVFIAKKDADSRMRYDGAVSYAASVEDAILPDKELLQWVYSNKTTINSKLQANGGVKLGGGDCIIGRYWSSTKNGNNYAWALAVNGGGVVSRSAGEMSCVRLFQIQCPTSYVTCEAPYEGVGEACNGKYESCALSYVEVGEYQGKKVFIAPTDADNKLSWNDAISYVESKGAILPDKELLQWVYDNKNAINNVLQANGSQIITPDPYWSSSEYNSGSAWVFYMNNYAAPKYEKKNILFHVRAFKLK